MVSKKTLLIGGGVVAAFLFWSRSASAATRLPTAAPTTKSGQGATSWLQGLESALAGLLKGGAAAGSGGGVGVSGGVTTTSASGGGLARTDGPVGSTAGAGNLGTYVVNGQPYNADGQAIDANGNPIPGVYDNTGLGPAGAGINSDGTIASNPLEISDGPLFGTVVALNTSDIAPVSTPSTSGSDLLAAAYASPDYTPPPLPSTDLSSAALPDTTGDDGFGTQDIPTAPSSVPSVDPSTFVDDSTPPPVAVDASSDPSVTASVDDSSAFDPSLYFDPNAGGGTVDTFVDAYGMTEDV